MSERDPEQVDSDRIVLVLEPGGGPESVVSEWRYSLHTLCRFRSTVRRTTVGVTVKEGRGHLSFRLSLCITPGAHRRVGSPFLRATLGGVTVGRPAGTTSRSRRGRHFTPTWTETPSVVSESVGAFRDQPRFPFSPRKTQLHYQGFRYVSVEGRQIIFLLSHSFPSPGPNDQWSTG